MLQGLFFWFTFAPPMECQNDLTCSQELVQEYIGLIKLAFTVSPVVFILLHFKTDVKSCCLAKVLLMFIEGFFFLFSKRESLCSIMYGINQHILGSPNVSSLTWWEIKPKTDNCALGLQWGIKKGVFGRDIKSIKSSSSKRVLSGQVYQLI